MVPVQLWDAPALLMKRACKMALKWVLRASQPRLVQQSYVFELLNAGAASSIELFLWSIHFDQATASWGLNRWWACVNASQLLQRMLACLPLWGGTTTWSWVEHALVWRSRDMQLLSFFDGSIDRSKRLAKLVTSLWETSITAHTLITIQAVASLGCPPYLLCVIQGSVSTIIRMQSHVEFVSIRLYLSWTKLLNEDSLYALIVNVRYGMLSRITPISWAIRTLATLSEHEVILADDERASLAERWHGIARVLWRRRLRLLLLLIELNDGDTLPFLFVVLKLPVLAMFLKFEIQCSLTRCWGRVILTDQTRFLS